MRAGWLACAYNHLTQYVAVLKSIKFVVGISHLFDIVSLLEYLSFAHAYMLNMQRDTPERYRKKEDLRKEYSGQQ